MCADNGALSHNRGWSVLFPADTLLDSTRFWSFKISEWLDLRLLFFYYSNETFIYRDKPKLGCSSETSVHKTSKVQPPLWPSYTHPINNLLPLTFVPFLLLRLLHSVPHISLLNYKVKLLKKIKNLKLFIISFVLKVISPRKQYFNEWSQSSL